MSEKILAGRYVLVEQIGIGGMAIVYRAIDRNTGQNHSGPGSTGSLPNTYHQEHCTHSAKERCSGNDPARKHTQGAAEGC